MLFGRYFSSQVLDELTQETGAAASGTSNGIFLAVVFFAGGTSLLVNESKDGVTQRFLLETAKIGVKIIISILNEKKKLVSILALENSNLNQIFQLVHNQQYREALITS